ncbi:MAG TPA: enoyl-CoA hydratase/isomerase family protein [Allosphingosinicella sp.]|nr:enoyl-CoA hydratase/isomerase family protein [Allosphingosinicella sp.]
MFRIEHEGEIARLVLDRPEARNAIPLRGWASLADAIDEIGRSAARLMLLSGAGGAFCAGADLGELAKLREDDVARVSFRKDMRRALNAIRALEIPAIAWIDGPCYGAGVALAMACDLRIAAPSSNFAITPAKIGISYPQEDVHRLIELVGSGQASRLLFTALSIDAAEAHRIGLVELLAEEVVSVADAVLANAGESLQALKQSIRLAQEGCRQDDRIDRRFDELMAGETLTGRLEALRRK